MVRTQWWLRSYSSQALERYKLKAECSFWYVLRFLILNLLRLQDAWTAYDRRAETKEERKRTRTTKWYTSNSLKLVEEVTPQIVFLDTKSFVISTDELFQMHISKKLFSRFFPFSGMKLEFLLLTGIK